MQPAMQMQLKRKRNWAGKQSSALTGCVRIPGGGRARIQTDTAASALNYEIPDRMKEMQLNESFVPLGQCSFSCMYYFRGNFYIRPAAANFLRFVI